MADLRPQFNEEVVAHGHPTKADVTNRAWNVEHEEDGTHKDSVIIADNLATDAVETAKIKNLNVTEGKIATGAVTNTKLGPDAVDDTKIGNAKVKKEHINADIVGTGLAGGAGTALSVDGIIEANAAELKVKVVNIGAWDMDAVPTVNIAHGLTLANIRHIEALIRNDIDNLYYMIHGSGSANDAWMTVDATNVNMTRIAVGTFDSVNFDTMGDDGNRGFITIWYVA